MCRSVSAPRLPSASLCALAGHPRACHLWPLHQRHPRGAHARPRASVTRVPPRQADASACLHTREPIFRRRVAIAHGLQAHCLLRVTDKAAFAWRSSGGIRERLAAARQQHPCRCVHWLCAAPGGWRVPAVPRAHRVADPRYLPLNVADTSLPLLLVLFAPMRFSRCAHATSSELARTSLAPRIACALTCVRNPRARAATVLL
jgi:hypothetical protein